MTMKMSLTTIIKIMMLTVITIIKGEMKYV